MPTHADAADGYTLTSATTYRVEPATPAVTVESTYHMTNTSPDVDLGGGRSRYYFFEGITLPIEAGAGDVSVEVNGRAAQFDIVDDIDGFTWLDVQFNSNLRYGKTATVIVRYALAGDPPRTETSFTRVNPAYVAFPLVAFGDVGEADLTVIIPDDWVSDQVGDQLRVRSESGTLVYEALGIESPEQFFAMFTARQDDLLESQPITVGNSLFELRGWPGDEEWEAFAEREVKQGVPVLERLTGTPWPESAETDVIEASTPYLRGYAGYYYADDDVIEVGEDLDSHTMLHELSHAWFNDSAIDERWLSEGLADEIGARAVAALGDPLPTPDDYDIEGYVNRAEFRLNAWSYPLGDDADPTEMYGYQQAFRVLRALSDEIGEEKMTALVAAVIRGDRAYPAEDGTSASTGTINWREFLDLAEQIGGSHQIVDLYRTHVVTPRQETDLDARQAALATYDALDARGGEWAVPAPVRTHMAQWKFVAADVDMDDASDALDVRDELVKELAPLGLTPVPILEERYQRLADLTVVLDELTEHADAADRLVESRLELTHQLDALGQDVPAFTQADYEQDPIESADTTAALVDQAAELASATAALDTTLADWELTVPALDGGAFVASPDAAIATLAGYQRAADAVADAHARRAEEPSFVERMGEIGSTADTLLAQADARLAAGDVAGATAAADSAHRAFDDWGERGRLRLQTAGATYAGLLLLIVVGLLIFGRSRPGGRDVEQEPAGGQTWPDAPPGDAADPADAGEAVTVDPDR